MPFLEFGLDGVAPRARRDALLGVLPDSSFETVSGVRGATPSRLSSPPPSWRAPIAQAGATSERRRAERAVDLIRGHISGYRA